MKLEKGRILEGFLILPSLSFHWMRLSDNGMRYDIQVAFLFWYVDISWEKHKDNHIGGGPDYTHMIRNSLSSPLIFN